MQQLKCTLSKVVSETIDHIQMTKSHSFVAKILFCWLTMEAGGSLRNALSNNLWYPSDILCNMLSIYVIVICSSNVHVWPLPDFCAVTERELMNRYFPSFPASVTSDSQLLTTCILNSWFQRNGTPELSWSILQNYRMALTGTLDLLMLLLLTRGLRSLSCRLALDWDSRLHWQDKRRMPCWVSSLAVQCCPLITYTWICRTVDASWRFTAL